ncbi:unnamed protein product, partial [Medioppia subpectinata]
MTSKWCLISLFALLAVQVLSAPNGTNPTARYEANWASLDKRPLPGWYDEAKIGVFLHWGIFSVPSYGDEWFWYRWKGDKVQHFIDYMKNNYKPGFTYQDFAADFTCEFFDPNHWADVLRSSGAKYVVMTTKHHEGYAMWPSKYSYKIHFCIAIISDLSKAVKGVGLKFGVYHSLMEWFHPLFKQDTDSGHRTQYFVDNKILPELRELVNNYKPDIIWSDGNGGGDPKYWKSEEFLAWLFNDSPVKDTVVVNDRWGEGSDGHHGSFYNFADNFNPGVLVPHKWEHIDTIRKGSWGYTRNINLWDILTPLEMLRQLAMAISCGGNMMFNIGPTREGTITPIFEERLRQLGDWLNVNGEAIYSSHPWTHQNDTLTKDIWFTSKDKNVYAIVLFWPKNNEVELGSVAHNSVNTIQLLGADGNLNHRAGGGDHTVVTFPHINPEILKTAYVLSAPNATKPTARYEPNWASLDKRPIPKWFDEAKIGIFIHWGVFSVPAYGDEWFWHRWKDEKAQYFIDFMKKNYKPNFTYQDFAKEFTAELYNPGHWADVFKASGAKYVVLTSKHHEGYTMWPSKYSYSWNAMDVGPNRDLVGDLANSVKASGLKFGVYHSLMEWFHPLFVEDANNGHKTQYFAKIQPELRELVNTYKPEIVWSDGNGGGDPKYWKSEEFLAWLYSDSPVKDTVVVNDRWGEGSDGHHGDFYNFNDNFNPGVVVPHKWEHIQTLTKGAWGYKRDVDAQGFMSPLEMLRHLAMAISCGGNMMFNIGPTKDGTIIPIMEERLRQMGDWLKINGEAIYSSHPWTHQNDTTTKDIWYTSKDKNVYAIVLFWPKNNEVELGSVAHNSVNTIQLLGADGNLNHRAGGGDHTVVTFPHINPEIVVQVLSAPNGTKPTARYEPNWASLDKRPLPAWYDEAKIGIFIHWGVFSVPSFTGEWFWHHWQDKKEAMPEVVAWMKANYRPGWTYQDFAQQFTAEFYDPNHWADVFKASGAKYVVLTTKHHDGYAMWPSKYAYSWNAMDVGPRRDLVGDLSKAVKASGLRFGTYHSLFEWFNPIFNADKDTEFKTQTFTKMIPELRELVETYKPDLIWSDGAGGGNSHPVKDSVVVNDRWGSETDGKHGDYYNYADRYNPGHLLAHKWENAMTIDKTAWGYSRNLNINQYVSPLELVTQLAQTVSCGGNILINIGPTKEGTIIPVFEERLRQLGDWLNVNGEAIYSSKPWTHQNDTITKDIWYTSKDKTVYAIVLFWPKNNEVELGSVAHNSVNTIQLLGTDGKVEHKAGGSDHTVVTFPHISPEALKTAYVLSAPNATKPTARYEPNWASLDKRPLPAWYDEAKVGIFVHWGVFSVPSYMDEWFWWHWQSKEVVQSVVDFMKANYRPGWTYQDFANQFTAEFYDPNHWADVFKSSGAKYVVLTTKHHEGYTLWPSKYSYSWNAMDVGPNRDLVGDLSKAVKASGLRFGTYHSLFEWFNPLFNADKDNGFKTQTFVETKVKPELYELVNTYKPDIIWSDGAGGGNSQYWKSSETDGKHGDFYNYADNYQPGHLLPHKWENAVTVSKGSWGYHRNVDLNGYLTTHELVTQLTQTVSCGGNILINVGPTKEGTITPIFEERLRQLGDWLNVNGEAIYSSKPWTHQNDTITKDIWYTSKDKTVYAIVLFWPKNNEVELGSVAHNSVNTIQLLGADGNLNHRAGGGDHTVVTFPHINPESLKTAYAAIVLYLLWSHLRWACLTGMGILVLFIPFQVLMGRMFRSIRQKTAELTDSRIRLMQ